VAASPLLAAAGSSAHFTAAVPCTRTTTVVSLVGIVTSRSQHMPQRSHVLASFPQGLQAARLREWRGVSCLVRTRQALL